MRLSHENIDKKKILMAAAALALGAKALRSIKIEGEDLTFDASVWGEKTKSVLLDVIDDTKQAAGRLAGRLIIGPNNQVEDVEPFDELVTSDASLEAMAKAVSSPDGWSGQRTEDTLQEG
jgi:hypothetical protein